MQNGTLLHDETALIQITYFLNIFSQNNNLCPFIFQNLD